MSSLSGTVSLWIGTGTLTISSHVAELLKGTSTHEGDQRFPDVEVVDGTGVDVRVA